MLVADADEPGRAQVSDPLGAFDSDSGLFKTFWPNYIHRPEQEAMAHAVARALGESRHLIVEAGTGVGKTLAYLVPLVDFAEKNDLRVVVSTETRALQQQILEKDMPTVERLLGRPIHAEVCLGAGNFVCKRRLANVLQEGEVDPGMMDRLSAFLDWEQKTEIGTRQDFPGSVPGEFWSKIQRDPDDCLASRCPNYRISYYFVAREFWKKARVLIVNHSLLAAHFAAGGRLLPEFQALVVDEAHRFPEIFHTAFSERCTIRELGELAGRAGASGRDLNRLALALQSELGEAFPLEVGRSLRISEQTQLPVMPDLLLALDRALLAVGRKLDEIRAQLELLSTAEEEIPASVEQMETAALHARLSAHKQLLARLLQPPRKDEVLWIERPMRGDDRVLHCAPVDPGPLVRDNLLAEIRPVVFTSATLATPGRNPFAYFARELGLRSGDSAGGEPEADNVQLSSPFRYEENALLYAPRPPLADPARAEAEFHRGVARQVRELTLASNGGAFVLFTSRRSLEAVERELRRGSASAFESGADFDPFPLPLISQSESGPHRAISLFRETTDAVLLGLATFWQGIDIPGDQLRMVILVRLPFRVPDDPLLSARIDRLREGGGEPFMEIQLPHAALQLKQGFGRLIRSVEDRGVVAILDPRLRTKRYGADLVSVLPPARRTTDLHEVRAFFDRP